MGINGSLGSRVRHVSRGRSPTPTRDRGRRIHPRRAGGAAGIDDPDPVVRALALSALVRSAVTEGRPRRGLADPNPRSGAARCSSSPAPIWLATSAPTWSRTCRIPTIGSPRSAAFAAGELEDVGDEVVAALVDVATTHDDSLCRERRSQRWAPWAIPPDCPRSSPRRATGPTCGAAPRWRWRRSRATRSRRRWRAWPWTATCRSVRRPRTCWPSRTAPRPDVHPVLWGIREDVCHRSPRERGGSSGEISR